MARIGPTMDVGRIRHHAGKVASAAWPLANKAVTLAPPLTSAILSRVHTAPGAETAVRGFSAHATQAGRLAQLTAALDAAGVAYVDLTTYDLAHRRTLVIAEADRVRLQRQVVPALARQGWTSRAGRSSVALWRDVVAPPHHDVLLGADARITVEWWAESSPDQRQYPPGSLVAPPWRRTMYLAPGTVAAAQTGDHRLPVERSRGVHDGRVGFPVDLVITWVDGADPAWRASYAATLDRPEPPAPERFTAHDELRYLLRSVEYFASWARQVILVVGQAPPAWLDLNHPKLRVVHHEEFMPAGHLPTFNSHSIESRLHHIDGLSEHFCYLNDDIFFGRPVTPDVFFLSNGMPVFFPSLATPLDPNPLSPHDSPATGARKQARDLLLADLGFLVTRRLEHTPYAMRVSLLTEMEERWPEVFAKTAASRLRRARDYPIEAFLAQWYGYATGRAVPGRLPHAYVPVAKSRARLQYAALMGRTKDVFCLNEGPEGQSAPRGTAPAYRAMARFLEAYFPVPSTFERP
ncbi:MAG: stealth family protein [Actinomycetia bacterium]|nr:stealth family protein [Actinomycetes bacterium]